MANPNHPNVPDDNEISEFLSKVDQIDTVLKGLNSSDENNVTDYMAKADDLIKKVEMGKKMKEEKELREENAKEKLPVTKEGFSKTSINRSAYKDDAVQPEKGGPDLPAGNMDQKAFMAAMEADAKQRLESKKAREKIANEMKEKGNAEFKEGNYTKALEFYDKAMDEIRDNLAIYTNRAQTRIKLGMFKEALTDCHWALRLYPGSMKAMVQEGHAHLALKSFENARTSYRQIIEIDPKKQDLVNDYVAEVDRQEQACTDEQKATELFDSGNDLAVGVSDFVHRINKEGQLPIYYSGGFRTITQVITNGEAQTLFRTSGGLQLPESHQVLNRLLTKEQVSSLELGERDLISAAMEMFSTACSDNETNQQKLLANENFPHHLTSMLEAEFKGQGRILKTSCLNLLHTISLTPAGRAVIVAKFDLSRLLGCLFKLMTKKSASYSETAAALLNNLALEKRLKSSIRDSMSDQILPAFESLIKCNKTPPVIISLACTTFTNLATDVAIRNQMSSRPSLWSALSEVMHTLADRQMSSFLESVLGLIINVCYSLTSASSNVLDTTNSIHQSCFSIVAAHQEDWTTSLAVSRSLAVLGALLPVSAEACQKTAEVKSHIILLMTFLQDGDLSERKSALKCLAALTQNTDTVTDIVVDNKGTSLLLKQLEREEENRTKGSGGEGDVVKKSKEDAEIILGNAILTLSHLCTRNEVCAKLTKTNIIQRLLVLARDGDKSGLQSNAAILIGKLVKGDQRHLERLRELHGIEILHQCMKYI